MTGDSDERYGVMRDEGCEWLQQQGRLTRSRELQRHNVTAPRTTGGRREGIEGLGTWDLGWERSESVLRQIRVTKCRAKVEGKWTTGRGGMD